MVTGEEPTIIVSCSTETGSGKCPCTESRASSRAECLGITEIVHRGDLDVVGRLDGGTEEGPPRPAKPVDRDSHSHRCISNPCWDDSALVLR